MTLATQVGKQHCPRWIGILLCLGLSASPIAKADAPEQLGIQQVGNWYAASDSLLIIEDHERRQYYAELKAPCLGLSTAKSIAFISNGRNTLDQSSKVILPDGKRCAFKSFTAKPPAGTNSQ